MAQATQQTLSIIKPDAVGQNQIGNIIEYLESNGLSVVAAKMAHLDETQAKKFYEVHKERPFYQELVKFMSSGPVLIMILEGADAVALNRKIMGPTDPADAPEGTIRGDFATSVGENAIHGSDSPDTAKEEIAFFFKPEDICKRSE